MPESEALRRAIPLLDVERERALQIGRGVVEAPLLPPRQREEQQAAPLDPPVPELAHEVERLGEAGNRFVDIAGVRIARRDVA